MSSGSRDADNSVEPTMSQYSTVSCRRSASIFGAVGTRSSLANALSRIRRWPTEDTPNATRSSAAGLLRELGVAPGSAVLDAASGIGTQTLGLIQQGYRVTASDISSGAIERLKAELSRRALHASVHVDDLRTLQHTAPQSMAAVIACDNSLPHLLSDAELLQALRSCHRCLRPGGVAVFSVRDYAAIERIGPDVRPYGLRHEAGGRFLAVQVWEWDQDGDPDHYDLRIYLTSESPEGNCETRVLRSRYYAVTIE